VIAEDAPVAEPTDLLAELQGSTNRLLNGLDAEGWSDADVAAPSLCAGWTRGHLLSHIARNADGITATLHGALRGEIVARYPRGWDARNKDIDDGSARPAAAQLADVRDSAARLEQAFDAIAAADAWDRPTDRKPAGLGLGLVAAARGRDPPRRPGRRVPSEAVARPPDRHPDPRDARHPGRTHRPADPRRDRISVDRRAGRAHVDERTTRRADAGQRT
jgi:uncharacterized protein (TIGR03083 family)